MNVLILSHMFPTVVHPTKGMFVVDQAQSLQKLGVNVRVISPQPWSPALLNFLPRVRKYSQIPARAVVQGIEAEYLRALQLPRGRLFSCHGLIYYLRCRRFVRELLKSTRVDLLHAHTAVPDGFAAVLLGREFGLPVVCTLHGSDINLYPWRSRAAYAVTQWVLRHIDHLMAVSYDLKQKAERMKGSGDMCVVPNATNPETFKSMPKLEARASLRLDPERKVILFVGNLVPVKGVEFLLEAIARLNRSDVVLYIIGDGPLELALKTRAEHLGIGTSCIFAGRQPHEQIPIWLCAADCLVLPSLSEGLPTIVAEAMICRTPVIATTVGGTPEVVADGCTGCLVPPADTAALTSAID